MKDIIFSNTTHEKMQNFEKVELKEKLKIKIFLTLICSSLKKNIESKLGNCILPQFLTKSQ